MRISVCLRGRRRYTSMAAGALMVGCGGSAYEEEHESGKVSEELVGGTATNARPEIGRMDGCTATLVHPRYIVTAAHCFDYQTGPQSKSFAIRNSSGVLVATPAVDFSYSLGSDVGSQDLAFGRLSSAVSSSTAQPATFATTAPASLAQVTVFGFGCTNRSTQQGFGTKRFVTYNQGNTLIGCRGDSGGPRVFGSATGSGAIFAIHSGAFDDGFGDDINADAVRYARPALQGVTAFGGTFTTNQSISNFNSWARESGVRAVEGNFNADSSGRVDIALLGGAGWTSIPVASSTTSGTFSVTNKTVANFPGWARQGRSVVAGDFDDDGDADIAVVGGSGFSTIPVAFSNGDGTFTVTNKTNSQFAGYATEPGAYAVAGNFGGDEAVDIALVGGSGWTTIPVAISNGDGSFTNSNLNVADFPAFSRVNGARAIKGNFDGDDFDDIALIGAPGWTTIPIAFSNGSGGFSVTNRTVADFPAWAAEPGVKIVSGNFDGDGDADLAAVGGAAWRSITFALSDGSGRFTPANLPMSEFPAWSAQAKFVFAGRVNSGPAGELVLLGGSGWSTIPVAYPTP